MSDNISKQSSSGKSSKATEVAELANVSVMTVSRVFSGTGYVAQATREKVMSAAKKIGYQPNMAARMLRTGKIENYGYLIPSVSGMEGLFHSESLAGFESIMSQHGLNAMLSIPPESKDFIQWAKSLISSGRCGGVAIQLDIIKESLLKELNQFKDRLILINYTPLDDQNTFELSSVGYLNRLGMKKAVKHLAAMGHKRIAYIGGNKTWHDSIRRERGFREGMAEVGLEVNEKWVKDCDFGRTFDGGEAEMNNIMIEGKPFPTAVMCASDEIAVGAYRIIRHYKLKIPNDISIVGFDNHPWSSQSLPPLTTLNHGGWQLGVEAAKLLLKMRSENEPKPQNVMLDTELIIRESTAPVSD